MKKFDINGWVDNHQWQICVAELVVAIPVAIWVLPYIVDWQRNIDSWQCLLFTIGCSCASIACLLLGNKLRALARENK